MNATTYSVPVGGPSPALAYLRHLWLRAAAAASTAWMHIRSSASLLFRLGRAAAETGLAVLASDIGYRAATSFVRGAASGLWRGIGAAVTGIGRGLAWVGHKAHRLVAAVSPRAAAWLERKAQHAAAPVRTAWTGVDNAVKGVGEVLWYLLQTPLVRRATTLAAQAASILLIIHALSKGAVAAKIVAAIPASMDIVVMLTNPVVAIGAVLGVAGAAVVVSLIRLLTRPDEDPDGDPGQEQEYEPHDGPEDSWESDESEQQSGCGSAEDDEDDVVQPLRVAEVLFDLEAIATKVRVEVKPDGSVIVHGIPADVPPDLGLAIAEIARNAVEQHLRRILLIRPTPSRDDKRLFTKAAREAIIAEARRRQREEDGQAA